MNGEAQQGLLDGMTNNLRRWVNLSVVMASRDDPMSMPEVQALGRLNDQLVFEERNMEAFRVNSGRDTALQLEHAMWLTDAHARSWLWVLGAYEVFRRSKNRKGPLCSVPEFLELNKEIIEIRIVLAKREAHTDPSVRQIPKSLIDETGSLGWGYWDRRVMERQFFRARFASQWLASAGRFRRACGLEPLDETE